MTLDKEWGTSETNGLSDWIEWFSYNRARVDLTSAAAAGVALAVTGVVLLKISMLDRVHPLDISDAAKLVLFTTTPYLAAGLIIHWVWIKPLRRIIPNWIMIALLGALLILVSAGARSFYTKSVAWSGLGDFIGDKVKDGLVVFVVLSLFTLPITGAVNYAGSIVRAVKGWYKGSQPPSILGNQRS